MGSTLKVLVAVVPDLSEKGGSDILEEMLVRGDESRVGGCLVIEADMDALALVERFRESGASELILFGPRHVEGRRRGVYTRRVKAVEPSMPPDRLVRELWPNLTGSLRLDDYVAALRILLGRGFTVAECEPGSEGCKGLLAGWLEAYCGGDRGR